jgi:hypothetical protein
MNEYTNVFLLRAFGDFIIAIHFAVKNQSGQSFRFLASKHFEPLFKALNLTLPPNCLISFIDLNIRRNIMGCLTNRYLFSPNSIHELLLLKQYIKHHSLTGHYYLEHKKRSWFMSFFCGYQFKNIISSQNVYQAYADFFSTSMHELENISFNINQSNLKVLVIPNARQLKREIPSSILGLINNSCKQMGFELNLGVFGNDASAMSSIIHTLRYRDFNELILLIKQFDIIIGSDSMPIHLAQFLSKPHYILYPQWVKNQFFTPFALKHQSYFTFEEIAERQSFFANGK